MPFWPTFLSFFGIAWSVTSAWFYCIYRPKFRDSRLVVMLLAAATFAATLAGFLAYPGGPFVEMVVPLREMLKETGVAPGLTLPIAVGASCLVLHVSVGLDLYLVTLGTGCRARKK